MEAFSSDDLRLLVLIANEASRVLENMWMVQQLRRKAEQLQTLVLVGQDMAGTRKGGGCPRDNHKGSSAFIGLPHVGFLSL